VHVSEVGRRVLRGAVHPPRLAAGDRSFTRTIELAHDGIDVHAIEIERAQLERRLARHASEPLVRALVLARALRLHHVVDELDELGELDWLLEVGLDQREHETHDVGAREHALPRQDLGVFDALRQLALVLRREQLVLRQLAKVRGEMVVRVGRANRLRRRTHDRLGCRFRGNDRRDRRDLGSERWRYAARDVSAILTCRRDRVATSMNRARGRPARGTALPASSWMIGGHGGFSPDS
jgi:hypothetical protein